MSKKNEQTQTPEVVEKTEKVELTEEQRQERITKLRQELAEAKTIKDTKAQKKIRGRLRKLGYWISKEKEKALEIVSATN